MVGILIDQCIDFQIHDEFKYKFKYPGLHGHPSPHQHPPSWFSDNFAMRDQVDWRSVKNIFDISGRAMSAQLLRLNTVASNLANANNVSGSAEDAYRAIKPVFETKYAENFLKLIGLLKKTEFIFFKFDNMFTIYN